MKNSVAVYILNHNYSKYLEQSILSVLNQTYKNFKLLIIDDGSTDNSKDILKNYLNDKRIRVIFQKKIGMIKSIIKAIKNTKSDFFVRLDADDWLHKDFLKETIKTINSHKDIALVFPDYFETDENSKIINRISRNKFNANATLLDFPAHGACTLFRRKLYNKTSGYSSNINAQDGYDIWLKIIKKFRVKNLNKPLFYYRQHQNNLTKNLNKILENRYKILEHQSHKKDNNKTLAFIPIVENNNQSLFNFKRLNKKKLIDITIHKALFSSKIQKIIISTNNEKLINYIRSKYKKYNKIIKIHYRDSESEMKISDSLINFLKKNPDKNIKNIAILTTEYPLTSQNELESAINTLNIFGANAVETVVNINSIFYYKEKNGMKIWGNKILKKERDNIFIRKGGITIINKKYFIKTKKIINLNKLAHLLIHQLKSLNFQELNEYKEIIYRN